MQPQQLDLKTAIPVIRASIDNRTLAAAYFPASMNNFCKNIYSDHDGIKCAVGMCLSPEVIEAIKTDLISNLAGENIEGLIDLDLISVVEDHRNLFWTIQLAHDQWLKRSKLDLELASIDRDVRLDLTDIIDEVEPMNEKRFRLLLDRVEAIVQ